VAAECENSDGTTDDDIPVHIHQLAIMERKSGGTIRKGYEEVDYQDGDVFTWTPWSSPFEPPVDYLSLGINGYTAEGKEVHRSHRITFSSDCMAWPIVQEGDRLGWLKFKSVDAPSDDHKCMCQDNPDFMIDDDDSKTCSWVAEQPSTRCALDWNTYTECPTVCHPQCSSTLNSCVDDPDAVVDDNDNHTCAWVSKNPETRCNLDGNEAFSKCPATCNPFCQLSCEDEGDDVDDYRVPGKDFRTCSWVAEKEDLSRCDLDEGQPYERCSATCNPGCRAFPSLN